jgi:hypothetical protein
MNIHFARTVINAVKNIVAELGPATLRAPDAFSVFGVIAGS